MQVNRFLLWMKRHDAPLTGRHASRQYNVPPERIERRWVAPCRACD